jgi:hypothetical protein
VSIKFFKRAVTFLTYKTVSSYFVKKHAMPYTTHLAVLLGVAVAQKPKKVLELGSGLNSTPYFGNDACFPTVKLVVSYEDDRGWFENVQNIVKFQNKIDLRFVTSIPENVRHLVFEEYDMIFIDDSISADQRQKTIAGALQCAGPETVIIVHDFENRNYQNTVKLPWKSVIYSSWKPFTGVIYQNRELDLPLAKLKKLIELNASVLPQDTERWTEIFKAAKVC